MLRHRAGAARAVRRAAAERADAHRHPLLLRGRGARSTQDGERRWVRSRRSPGCGVRDAGHPRRPAARRRHRRGRAADLAGDDVRPGRGRRAPGLRVLAVRQPDPHRGRGAASRRSRRPATGWRSPAGWPPRTTCCGCCRQGGRVLLGNDAYGGTFRLISKVWEPLGVPVDGRRPERRRRARRDVAGRHRRWCGWRRRPTRC